MMKIHHKTESNSWLVMKYFIIVNSMQNLKYKNTSILNFQGISTKFPILIQCQLRMNTEYHQSKSVKSLQNVHYLPQLCQHPESSYLLAVVAYADNVDLSADTVDCFTKCLN